MQPKYLKIGETHLLTLPYSTRKVVIVGYDLHNDYVIYQDEYGRQDWLPECLFVLGIL